MSSKHIDWRAVQAAASTIMVLAAMSEYSDTGARRTECMEAVKKLNKLVGVRAASAAIGG